MSQVKFEQRETVRTTGGVAGGDFASRAGDFVRGGPRDAPQGKQDLAHDIGNALTKGAGPNGYLAVSIGDIVANLR